MNEISKNKQRIAFVAALFGVLAAIIMGWAFDYSFFGAILIGLIVAAIVALVLWQGWTEPHTNKGAAPTASNANPAASTPSDTPTAAASAMPAAVTTSPLKTPVAATQEPAAVKTAKPAAAKAKAAKPSAAKVAKPAAAKVAKPAAAKAAKPAAAKAAKPAAEKAAKPAVAKAAKPAVAKAAKPATAKPAVLDKPRAGVADDLKMIKGVGPVLEKALNASGVYHFDQVAVWKKSDAVWFDENVKGANGRVVRDEWVKQAKVLAKGGTTEFADKVKKGGVY